METNGKIYFEERQHFRVQWVWFVVLFSVFSSILLTLGISLSEKGKFRDSLITLGIIIPLELCMLYLFYIARLDIVVTSEGIYYRWWPFQRRGRFIGIAEIATAEMRAAPSYHYGTGFVAGYGKINTTGPGQGIQFTLGSGRKIFIGSKTPALLSEALLKIVNVSPGVKTSRL